MRLESEGRQEGRIRQKSNLRQKRHKIDFRMMAVEQPQWPEGNSPRRNSLKEQYLWI
jgi:hypothetical protein